MRGAPSSYLEGQRHTGWLAAFVRFPFLRVCSPAVSPLSSVCFHFSLLSPRVQPCCHPMSSVFTLYSPLFTPRVQPCFPFPLGAASGHARSVTQVAGRRTVGADTATECLGTEAADSVQAEESRGSHVTTIAIFSCVASSYASFHLSILCCSGPQLPICRRSGSLARVWCCMCGRVCRA